MAKKSVVYLKGIEKLSKADLRALNKAAEWIGVDVDWLAVPMHFETAGTFSPSIENAAGSGAVGLIQFMPATAARLLGWPNTEANRKLAQAKFKKMTFRQQLEYVKKYFAPHRGKLKSLEDVYLAIFYPAEIGKKQSDVIGAAGTAVYRQNKGFDAGNKGYITRGDVTSSIINKAKNAAKSGRRVDIPSAFGAGAAIALAAVSYGGYVLYSNRSKS